MKKSYLIVVILTIFMSVNAIAFLENNRNDELIKKDLVKKTYSEYNSETNVWEDIYVSDYTYENDLLSEMLVKKFNGDIWGDFELYNYSYDENGNITEELYQYWYASWINYQKKSYTYDSQDNLIQYRRDSWNETEWQEVIRIDYSYDENNNIQEEIWSYAEVQEGYKYRKCEYLYNNSSYKTQEAWYKSLVNDSWNEDYKQVYTRDFYNYITEITKFNYEDSEYRLNYKENYEYINDYDISDVYGYNYVNGDFENDYWEHLDYSDDLRTTTYVKKIWDSEDNDWLDNMKVLYEYNIVSNDNHNVESINQINLFPNPAKKILSYKSSSKIQKLEIFNIKGQKVFDKDVNSFHGEIHLGKDVSKGIYFLRTCDNEGNKTTRKFIKIK